MGGSDLYTGTLELLILRILRDRAQHGYGVGRALRRVSEGVVDVAEGVLYPALHRLEARGLLASHWGTSETGRRAKYYELTPSGRAHLEGGSERWRTMQKAVRAVLEMGAGGSR